MRVDGSPKEHSQEHPEEQSNKRPEERQDEDPNKRADEEPKNPDAPLNIMLFYADDWTMKVMGKLNPD
ncbi:MAG: hypothetical protein ACKO4X_18265, partial [Alphaproteobacteria bacterium]